MNLKFCSFVLLFIGSGSLAAAARDAVEVKTFSCQPGYTLTIQNNYGRVRVRTWDSDRVEVKVRRIAADERRLNNISLLSGKSGTKISLQASFKDHSTESVYIEVRAPKYLNLLISGADPAVEVYGIEGHLRASTLTGLVTAEDLTSSASLLTERGDILYRSRIQPGRDIRLESIHGDVRCYLNENLNLRSWTRAGGKVSWNQQIELKQGFLERQLGVGGPLLLASSTHGNVTIRLQTQRKPQATQPPTRLPSRELPLSQGAARPPQVEIPKGQQEELTSTDPAPANGPDGTGSPVEMVSFPAATDHRYRVRVNVDWIYLNVSVREHSTRRSIPHLRKADFLVYEDGVRQTIEKFESTEAPFNLLLLLDVSGSTGKFIDLIKQASIEFTREIKPNDRIAVATFNSYVLLIQQFTNDRRKVAGAISRLRSGGGTAFYDALRTSIRDYMEGIEGRKAIVVFTDGVDNQLTGDDSTGSRTTFHELYRDVQEIDSMIYTIFLDTEEDLRWIRPGKRRGGTLGDILGDIMKGGTPPYSPYHRGRDRFAYEEARRQLRMIADQTGGRMYSPQRISDLLPVYREIAHDLRVQYTLGYNSTNGFRDGRWREVKVQLRQRKDAVVRTRKGYYAGRPKRTAAVLSHP